MSGNFFKTFCKRSCLAGMMAAFLGLGNVRGQDSMEMPPPPYPLTSATPTDRSPVLTYAPPGTPAPGDTIAAPAGPAKAPMDQGLLPSRWILYDRSPGCCGPTGGNGPIGYEVYLQSGIAFPVGGTSLNNTLDLGWQIQGGARTLFFNPDATAAWTVDVGVGNIYNHVKDQTRQFPLFNVFDALTQVTSSPVVTGRDLNRTTFNLALGREYYLMGSAEHDGCNPNWRVGCDFGGRYGSAKLEVNNNPHLTDTIAGMFVSVHSDFEFPCGQWILQVGLRAEYGYTWSDILQIQNNSDVQEINLLLTAGVRF